MFEVDVKKHDGEEGKKGSMGLARVWGFDIPYPTFTVN